ncbi:la protein homolog [Euwallacea similis]|uniref:la protein homolog n=1 Tax=Euwallacea similis TaxID=1736056 RepID=UPI00344F776C
MANDLDKKIIRQMEYYFGDINLPRDKFLQGQIKENEEGWVPLEVMLKFKRLAQLSEDPKIIAKALEQSEDCIVVINEDKSKVRRNPEKPLPENNDQHIKTLRERTAYAKGFPLDAELNDIINFMDDQGPIDSVIRRTGKDHKFKGSCFIVFKTIELAKKFVDLKDLKYKDNELVKKMQTDYYANKKKEIEEKKKAQAEKKQAILKENAQKIEFPSGAILHFSGIPEGQQVTREEIKEKVGEESGFEVVYVDYSKGDQEGYIRFSKENNAVDFFKTLQEPVFDLGEHKLKLKVLEGDEEKEYLQKTSEAMAMQRQKQKQGRKRKGNFGGKKNAKHTKKE